MAKKTVAAKKRNVKVDANGQLHVHSSCLLYTSDAADE